MGRPKKEVEIGGMVKVKRVEGNKVNRHVYFNDKPDDLISLLAYNIIEIPQELVEEINGIKVVSEVEKVEEI